MITKNDNGTLYVDFETDIAVASIYMDESQIAMVGIDDSYQSQDRKLEPKVILVFKEASDIDWFIEQLLKAKVYFNTHSDNDTAGIPSASPHLFF